VLGENLENDKERPAIHLRATQNEQGGDQIGSHQTAAMALRFAYSLDAYDTSMRPTFPRPSPHLANDAGVSGGCFRRASYKIWGGSEASVMVDAARHRWYGPIYGDTFVETTHWKYSAPQNVQRQPQGQTFEEYQAATEATARQRIAG